MNPADLEAWRSARTFAGLCELTACWIEGTVGEVPGYDGPPDVGDPEMVPVLAALNRAGYMITSWQPGGTSDDIHPELAALRHGGWPRWEQCAAVEGFTGARTARNIMNYASMAGLTAVIHDPPPRLSRRFRFDRAVTVTWLEGEPHVWYGTRLPVRLLRDPRSGYGICHPAAVSALCRSWQVAVTDPERGRPDLLWNTLTRALVPGGAR